MMLFLDICYSILYLVLVVGLSIPVPFLGGSANICCLVSTFYIAISPDVVVVIEVVLVVVLVSASVCIVIIDVNTP